MKTTQRKAMELALEVLSGSYAVHPDEAIAALQDALHELEQKPHCWFRCEDGEPIYYKSKCWDDLTPLYAAPVRTKDLTDDEILKALGAKSYDECSERELADAILDARAVIAADREKNK